MYVVNISQQNGGFPLAVRCIYLRITRESATWNVPRRAFYMSVSVTGWCQNSRIITCRGSSCVSSVSDTVLSVSTSLASVLFPITSA